jgi:hypothetical protein
MATALRNWMLGTASKSNTHESSLPAATAGSSPLSIPGQFSIPSSESDDDEGEDTEKEEDDQTPAFPSLNSAQRLGSGRRAIDTTPSVLAVEPDTAPSMLMPPPPNAALGSRTPGAPQPRTGSSSLMLPPSTTQAPIRNAKKREKVALAPGFGPLDWAALKSGGQDLKVRATLYGPNFT